MPEIFINYRTGDGEEAALTIELALSQRFGEDRVFRASSKIKPGEAYPDKLLSSVRQSAVLLAVIGPDWPHHPQLRNPGDWVRRELLEARTCGIQVIPVLKGRKTDRLAVADLPKTLAWLADVQSLRMDTKDNGRDLARIGDELARLVPSLGEADRGTSQSSASDTIRNSASDVRGAVVQGRDITGDVGTVIKGNQGSVHLGTGDINHESQTFSGDGATYIRGDNHGGVNHDFGGSRRGEEDR